MIMRLCFFFAPLLDGELAFPEEENRTTRFGNNGNTIEGSVKE